MFTASLFTFPFHFTPPTIYFPFMFTAFPYTYTISFFISPVYSLSCYLPPSIMFTTLFLLALLSFAFILHVYTFQFIYPFHSSPPAIYLPSSCLLPFHFYPSCHLPLPSSCLYLTIYLSISY